MMESIGICCPIPLSFSSVCDLLTFSPTSCNAEPAEWIDRACELRNGSVMSKPGWGLSLVSHGDRIMTGTIHGFGF
jgi:hypothetical protein